MKAVYPGTFDPVHYGHLDLIRRASAIFDDLIVGVYAHNKPIKETLFSVEKRVSLIEEAVGDVAGISVMPFTGLTAQFAQEIGAKVMVRGLRVFSDFEFEFRFALANERLAPDIEIINLITRGEHTFISGTTVREIASLGGDISSMVPTNVAHALTTHFSTLD